MPFTDTDEENEPVKTKKVDFYSIEAAITDEEVVAYEIFGDRDEFHINVLGEVDIDQLGEKKGEIRTEEKNESASKGTQYHTVDSQLDEYLLRENTDLEAVFSKLEHPVEDIRQESESYREIEKLLERGFNAEYVKKEIKIPPEKY